MKAIVVSAGIIVENDRALICKRSACKQLEGGKWEFPGGKVEEGETPEQALERELKEELGISVDVEKIFDARIKSYGETYVLVIFYTCRIVRGSPQALEHDEIRYVELSRLNEYDLADTDRRVAELINANKEKTDA